MALGLTVAALLSAFGVGAALLPPAVLGAAATTRPGDGPAEAGRLASPGGSPSAGPARPADPGNIPAATSAAPAGDGPDGTAPSGAAAPGASVAPGGAARDAGTGRAPAGPGARGDTLPQAGGTGQAGRGPESGGPESGGPDSGGPDESGSDGARSGAPERNPAGPVPRSGGPAAGQRTASAGDEEFAAMEDEVVTLTNVERRRNGCGDLTTNPALRTAMRLHVQEIARHDGLYLSHVSDDGRTFAERARQQGYTDPGAENVARGQNSPAEVVQGWMASPGHRANIVNCRLKAIGVGVARGDGTLVWGQVFGRS